MAIVNSYVKLPEGIIAFFHDFRNLISMQWLAPRAVRFFFFCCILTKWRGPMSYSTNLVSQPDNCRFGVNRNLLFVLLNAIVFASRLWVKNRTHQYSNIWGCLMGCFLRTFNGKQRDIWLYLTINIIWLVVWNIFFYFSIQLGISWSQLTTSYFSEGFKAPTSNIIDKPYSRSPHIFPYILTIYIIKLTIYIYISMH